MGGTLTLWIHTVSMAGTVALKGLTWNAATRRMDALRRSSFLMRLKHSGHRKVAGPSLIPPMCCMEKRRPKVKERTGTMVQ